jgi:hypothetical protein
MPPEAYTVHVDYDVTTLTDVAPFFFLVKQITAPPVA